MNKCMIIQILKQLIILYKQNLLNENTYEKTILKTTIYSIDETSISENEVNFMCFLLENFPYYQIFDALQDIINIVNKWNNDNPKMKSISLLLQGCIDDFYPNIQARINMEVNIHIYKIMAIYYQRNYLDSELTINCLKRNICLPAEMVSLEVLNEVYYHQEIIPGILLEEEELRERVSKTNYRKKINIENMVFKNIVQYFNDDSFQKFVANFINLLIQNEGELGFSNLKDIYYTQLLKLYKKALKDWELLKEKEDLAFQYSLHY